MRRPIRLAVLECDNPLPQTAAKYGGRFGGVFKALLGQSAKTLNRPDIVDPEAGLDISEYDIVGGDDFPALEDVDAVLISGSSACASYLPSLPTPFCSAFLFFCSELVD